MLSINNFMQLSDHPDIVSENFRNDSCK